MRQNSLISTLWLSFTLPCLVQAKPSIQVNDPTCKAINQAIQMFDAKGGEVILPSGTIDCDEPIKINRSHITLIGQGRGDIPSLPFTKIVMRNGQPAPVLVIGVLEVAKETTQRHGDQYYPVTKVEDIMVKNLAVDGNRDRSIPLLDKECYDLENNQSKSCADDGGKYIRNNGITVRRAEDIRIENVSADRCYSGGMVLEKKSARIHVDNFIARDNAFDGFAGYETHSSTFKNIYLLHNAMSGISIDFEFEPSHDPSLQTQFTGNTFDVVYMIGNGDNGIFSHSLGGNVFKNLYLADNGNFGVYIDGIRQTIQKPDGTNEIQLIDGTCDGNQFINIVDLNSKNSTLRINHRCKNTTVSNLNSYKTKANQCIDLFDGAQTTTTKVHCFYDSMIEDLPIVKLTREFLKTSLKYLN